MKRKSKKKEEKVLVFNDKGEVWKSKDKSKMFKKPAKENGRK